MRHPSILGSSFVFLAGFVIAASARAAIISEVRLGPPGTADNYVELTLTLGDTPFDLVILDASPSRQTTIKAVVTVRPAPGKSLVLLHENTWPTLLPAATIDMPMTAGSLNLGGDPQLAGASRRLVVFTGVTGWAGNPTAPSLSQWASTSGLPAVADVLTYTVGSLWSATSVFGEPLFLTLAPGDALWRHVDPVTGDFTSDFSTGPVDDLDIFLNDPHVALDPGLVNIPYTTITATDDPPADPHHPEPATSALLAVSATLLLARRSGRN